MFNRPNQNRTISKTEVFKDGEDIVTRVTSETRVKQQDKTAELDAKIAAIQAQKAELASIPVSSEVIPN